jgi:hypothetical protein
LCIRFNLDFLWQRITLGYMSPDRPGGFLCGHFGFVKEF